MMGGAWFALRQRPFLPQRESLRLEPHHNSPIRLLGRAGLATMDHFPQITAPFGSECRPKGGRMAVRVEYHIAKIARLEVRNILRQANRSQLTSHPRPACTCSGQGKPPRAERNRSS